MLTFGTEGKIQPLPPRVPWIWKDKEKMSILSRESRCGVGAGAQEPHESTGRGANKGDGGMVKGGMQTDQATCLQAGGGVKGHENRSVSTGKDKAE